MSKKKSGSLTYMVGGSFFLSRSSIEKNLVSLTYMSGVAFILNRSSVDGKQWIINLHGWGRFVITFYF